MFTLSFPFPPATDSFIAVNVNSVTVVGLQQVHGALYGVNQRVAEMGPLRIYLRRISTRQVAHAAVVKTFVNLVLAARLIETLLC